ncbi:MAG: NADAR family protein, partial [Pseudobdellovibrionaceae bacterium]
MFQFLATGLCGFIMACGGLSDMDASFSYPSEWWKPVAESDLASWEIGPQAADPNKNEVILSKRTELGILSNLSATPFTLDGHRYASIEGLWQSLKYPENDQDPRQQDPNVKWELTRAQVMQLTSFEAKKAGDAANENMKKLGITWVTYQGIRFEPKALGAQTHYELIYRASVAKVEQNSDVRAILAKTGNLKLLPDHHQAADVTPAY